MNRIVSWFSCGAASAVATKLAIDSGRGPVTAVRCWVAEEHPDNGRFAADCARWFGQEVITLRNEKYNGSVDEVIRQGKFIAGAKGAPCTLKLKKEVRKKFQLPTDTQVFGYTADEQDRYDSFVDSNNDVDSWPILIEHGLTHTDCLALVERAGIELPVMYRLGYKHNNCMGCVKGGAGYWNKVRIDFPERFAAVSKLERLVGHSIIRIQKDRVRTPVFLDELSPTAGRYQDEPEIQCGINCELVAKELINT
jgi:hypothetical protein